MLTNPRRRPGEDLLTSALGTNNKNKTQKQQTQQQTQTNDQR
jgi:hypothetical protein